MEKVTAAVAAELASQAAAEEAAAEILKADALLRNSGQDSLSNDTLEIANETVKK